jgi:hypothetical protein
MQVMTFEQFWQSLPQAEQINKELALKIWENARLNMAHDNPILDATPLAHPAWWRAHEHTLYVLCDKINAVIDGKDSGVGVSREPWQSVRLRLRELVLKQPIDKSN